MAPEPVPTNTGDPPSTEQAASPAAADQSPDISDQAPHQDWFRNVQLWIFCGLLALALIGMGVTQSTKKGGWEYWLFLVLVYAGFGIFRAWRKARMGGERVWPVVRKKVLHWVGVFVAFKIIFLLQNSDILSREAASDVALIVLALSCVLAGVHFDWMFALLGVVLAIMVIALAYTEQYTVWLIMIPVAAVAVWVFVKRTQRRFAPSVD